MRIRNHFHINGVTLSLALKQRLEATQEWPISLNVVAKGFVEIITNLHVPRL